MVLDGAKSVIVVVESWLNANCSKAVNAKYVALMFASQFRDANQAEELAKEIEKYK